MRGGGRAKASGGTGKFADQCLRPLGRVYYWRVESGEDIGEGAGLGWVLIRGRRSG